MDNSTPGMEETLVRLLDGELSPEERSSVEQQLAADVLLQQQYDSLLATRAAIRHFGLHQQVSTIHRQMMDELNTPVKKISPVRKMIRYTSAIAAGVILLVGVFFTYQYFSLSPEKVFSANYQPFEISTVRGTTTSQPVEDAYRRKDYAAVLRLYNTAEPSIKTDFLAGAAALEMNDLQLAESRFSGVIEKNKAAQTTILLDEAEYYLSLTLIREHKYDAAIVLLEKIQRDSGHIYHDKVKDGLLKDVKRLR